MTQQHETPVTSGSGASAQEYLEKRQLQKSAGWVLLWALGVGAVISGDYFGWNFGLTAGGFWGLAIAVGAVALAGIRFLRRQRN